MKPEFMRSATVVADLGKLFKVPSASGFKANEFDSNRDLLYTAMHDINTAVPGGLHIIVLNTVASAALAANAQAATADALAYRYALVNGNPFAVLGADYSPHNPSGALDLYVPATGAGNLTGQYLKDRSGTSSPNCTTTAATARSTPSRTCATATSKPIPP